ncbi:MAG: hypothetical protein ABMA14_03290 [Hyphomonadaceae bacterium]
MTQAKHTATPRQTFATGAVVSLLTMSGVFAPIAAGQDEDLIAELKAGVSCVEPDAGSQLLRNADASAASLTDLLMALDSISIDDAACVPIRDAASGLALELSDANPGLDPAEATASIERMEQALAEADKRAAAMRFEVGPPPRNLTRSRAAPS